MPLFPVDESKVEDDNSNGNYENNTWHTFYWLHTYSHSKISINFSIDMIATVNVKMDKAEEGQNDAWDHGIFTETQVPVGTEHHKKIDDESNEDIQELIQNVGQ